MSSSDDVAGGGWQVSPETRRLLRLQAARTAIRRHDFRRAVVEAEELLDELPDDRDGLWTLAESAMELRDHQVALEAWRSLAVLPPPKASIFTQLGVCAFETAAFEEAEQAARAALAVSDDTPDAWYLLGLCAERRAADEEAWSCFERAHRGSPLGWPLPLPLDDDDVRDLVQDALAELPREVELIWSKTELRIERMPAREDLVEAVPPISPRVLALYDGQPPVRPDGTSRPTALRVYRVNLAHHESRDHAIDALVETLENEAVEWMPDPA